MANLIDQMTALIRQRDNIEESDARFIALKEIVFAGLARGSFFRDHLYLPEMDSLTKDCLYLTFLSQKGNESFSPDPFYSFLKNELDARGNTFTSEVMTDGFEAVYASDAAPARLRVFVYPCDVIADRIKVECGTGTLFYETRYVEKATDDERKSIRKALQTLMKGTVKKERAPKKQSAEPVDNGENKWVRPSLFDF